MTRISQSTEYLRTPILTNLHVLFLVIRTPTCYMFMYMQHRVRCVYMRHRVGCVHEAWSEVHVHEA